MNMSLAEVNRKYKEMLADGYTLVPGEGNPRARLVLVGEAPGAQEEAAGRPFVGTAGKNLDAFLQAVQLSREDLYITNAVKFRPTKRGASGRLSNRTPTREEVALFQPWLMEELYAIRPAVVATLGNTALRAVTGEMLTIGDVHGVPLSLGEAKAGIFAKASEVRPPWKVFPLYHPASIIYRRALKDTYDEDVRKLEAYLRAL